MIASGGHGHHALQGGRDGSLATRTKAPSRNAPASGEELLATVGNGVRIAHYQPEMITAERRQARHCGRNRNYVVSWAEARLGSPAAIGGIGPPLEPRGSHRCIWSRHSIEHGAGGSDLRRRQCSCEEQVRLYGESQIEVAAAGDGYDVAQTWGHSGLPEVITAPD